MIDFNKIFIDTAPYIYFLEHNDEWFTAIDKVFHFCIQNNKDMVTSVATIEEYQIKPYRDGDLFAIENFKSFLSDTNTDVKDITMQTADVASQLRAKYSAIKAMDALQLASAIESECDIFLTNDKRLKKCNEIYVLTIENLDKA